MGSPRKAKIAWAISKRTVASQQKKIKSMAIKNKRLKDKVFSLKSLIKHMKSKFGMTETAENLLEVCIIINL